MRTIAKEQLSEILGKHKKWMHNEEGGELANLTGANLYRANLTGANLTGANLYRANLTGANLAGANLTEANLTEANLTGANLYRANLTGANLTGADLSGAENVNTVKWDELTAFFGLACPEEGEFIGWKKAHDMIVKLRITEDAKRSSATSRKCRCSKAEVLEIQCADGSASHVKSVPSDRNGSFVYTVGEMVEVHDFDDDRWNECSRGIHFFITRQEAVNY